MDQAMSDSVSDAYVSAHDPLCEWATPCIHGENQQHSRDTENPSVPDATYCWMCGADCDCDLIAKVLAAAAQRVEALPGLLARRAEVVAAINAIGQIADPEPYKMPKEQP